MNAKQQAQRAEWAKIREAEQAARLERKMRQAEALDPALADGALLVHEALERECFTASIGFNGSRHIVTVRGVNADARPRVEKVANKALKGTTRYPDVVAFQSFMRIEVKEGREAWEFERKCQRDGEDGLLLCHSPEHGWYHVGAQNHPKPLANAGLDYEDPYAA